MDGIRRVTSSGVREGLILMEPDRIDERLAPVIESGLPSSRSPSPRSFRRAPRSTSTSRSSAGWSSSGRSRRSATGSLLFGAPALVEPQWLAG
ncbi:hypothetical protein [Brachybacterium sp. GPGPB12]|uniref:hypothetical protein n=1 Tax=Brachybacterium sp. GPGPB12 TaxID=3023517 RepID=UPI0031345EB7